MTDIEMMLKAQEGTGPVRYGRFFPYVDTVGKTTIGYGRCLDTKGISDDMARMMFSEDIADAIDIARRVCSVYNQLSRPRQLVLISLAFNLGMVGMNKWVRFLNAIHKEDWNEAADELLDSKAAKEDAPTRYKQLAKMMRQDVSIWV